MFRTEIEALVDMTDAELHEHVRGVELERRTLDARLAAAIAVADARQLNVVVDGHRSMTSYLRGELNYSTAEASRWLQVGKMVDALPAVGDAWINGHIGSAQTAVFASTYGNKRVRECLDRFVPTLLEQAELLPFSDFRACVTTFVTLADEDGAHDDRDHNIVGRRAHVVDVGGTLDVRVSGGDGLTAAEMITIHQAFVDLEYAKDLAARRDLHGDDADDHELARTSQQRSHDAIIEIFRRAAICDVEGRPLEMVVNVVSDARTFVRMLHAAGLASEGSPVGSFARLADPSRLLSELVADPAGLKDRRCETSTGVQLHAHDVLRAALAGHVRRVVLDSDGVIIDMGRKARLFTGSARAAAKLLIRRCQRPGCELPSDFSEVDHNQEWSDHGETSQANANIMCGPDNRLKHRHKWRQQRATDGNSYMIRADGTIMLPVGARPPTLRTDHQEDDDDDDGWDDPDETERINRHIRQRLADAVAAAA